VIERCQYARFRAAEKPSENIPFGARSVGHHTVPPRWRDNIFVVHHIAIYWGIAGTGGIVLNGDALEFPPEHIGIYLSGTAQEIYALDEEWEYCWWTMDGPSAEQIVRGFGYKEGLYEAGPAPVDFISSLESVIQGPGRRNEINAAALTYQLLSFAAQHHGQGANARYDHELVEAVTDLILASWQDPQFGVNWLAAKLDIHRSTLSRQFHLVTGTTLSEYITSVRVQNAMSMLQETSLPVAVIARQCGYADPDYFSKLIKTRLGVPPSRFRKRSAPVK